MIDSSPLSYDQVPYPSLAYVQSHPDRLATWATLLGQNPKPIDRCRVLELGCASGGNLIPMAYGLPGSEFLGLDISSRQIADARNMVAEMGLSNIAFECMDILDVSPDLGAFDYVIAHGVYSWVPPEIQDKVLQICKQNLSADGVAYISYNTYPGWHMMNIIRDAMLYHTRDAIDPQARAVKSRSLLDFLVNSVSPDNLAFGNFLQAYANFLRGEIEGMEERGNAFLLHDELEATNIPVYFHQFMARAAAQGLQYLIEADPASVFPGKLAPQVRQTLQEMARDVLDMEQYIDFVCNRMFRQTLLCHNGVAIERGLTPERLKGLYIASRARPVSDNLDVDADGVEQFKSPNGATLSTDHPVSKAAMVYLGQVWPHAVVFDDLLSVARTRVTRRDDGDAVALAVNLLKAFGYSTQLLELHTHMPPLAKDVGERPLASRVAISQARDGSDVTNLWHERVPLNSFTRHLLRRLDGTKDREALLDELQSMVSAGRLTVKQDGQSVKDARVIRDILAGDLEQHLYWLARAALLLRAD
jgi:methyltransferase-like protein/SAM-dependent methyltransferase